MGIENWQAVSRRFPKESHAKPVNAVSVRMIVSIGMPSSYDSSSGTFAVKSESLTVNDQSETNEASDGCKT